MLTSTAARKTVEELNDLPIKTVGTNTIYIRDVAHVRDGYPSSNEHGSRGWAARHADDGSEVGQCLHARHHLQN